MYQNTKTNLAAHEAEQNTDLETMKQEILLEGKRILRNQQLLQETVDDFENLDAEDVFLEKLAAGEESIVPAIDEEPQDSQPLAGDLIHD